MLNIKTDSRKVVKGDTFIALKGNTVDGHDFIDSAIKNGAEKIICEHGKYDVDTINVSDTHEYLKDFLCALDKVCVIVFDHRRHFNSSEKINSKYEVSKRSDSWVKIKNYHCEHS